MRFRRREKRSISSVGSVLRAVFRRHRWSALGLVFGALVAGLAESAILALVASTTTAMVVDDGAVDAAIGPLSLDMKIPVALALAAILGVLRLTVQVGLAYLPARMAADTQAEMRNGLFDAYSEASWDVQAGERDGHLQELLTNQVGLATQGWMQATTLLSSSLTFLTLVVAAFVLGPLTALLVLVVAVLLGAVLRPLSRQGRQFARKLSQAQIDYAGAVGTAVRMAEETYAFGTGKAERVRLIECNERTRYNFIRSQFATRLTQGVYQGLVILLLVGAIAGLYASGTGKIASLGAVVLILVRAAGYGQLTQVAWQVVQQAGPYLERLDDAERRYRSHPPVTGELSFPRRAPIVMQDVSFRYRPDRSPVLVRADIDIQPGEMIGIVGPSGAGKSTLVQLLLRMRTPTSGSFTVGGLPAEDIALDEWHRRIAYVPQEPRLLSASVADNIRFDRDISLADVEQAARQAHIHDVIMSMPDGYDTIVGQRVDAVSGGQRQRLCLARALAGHPDVLVLDEPTSALDAASEVEIRASLEQLHGDTTILVVAHRPTLLEVCDRIIRVDGGLVSASAADAALTLGAASANPLTGDATA